MSGPRLLTTRRIEGDVRRYLAARGEVFADFDDDESGCIAHGVAIRGQRLFVKQAVAPRGAEAQARAMAVHAAVRHPTLVPLLHAIAGDQGPILVFPWIDGERLRETRRTATLPTARVLEAIRDLIHVHVAIERAGFVSIDLYDGNLLYDGRIHLIDVDEYRPSPFVLQDPRTKGSTRFMAPEEFRPGSILDSRTMVFQLGRAAAVLLDPPEGADLGRAPEASPLVVHATRGPPQERYRTVVELAEAWRELVGGGRSTAPFTITSRGA